VIEIKVTTTRRTEAVNITQKIIKEVKGKEGNLLHIYTPHTTCGLVINEEADPDVMKDVLDGLERLAPHNYPYAHREGNADAHIKSSLTGCSVTVPFEKGTLKLGTWQGIFLMEFDGPRERKVFVTIL